MKKFYFTLFVFTFVLIPIVNGQYGKHQAGLRAGYTGGVFYQITSDAGNAEIGYNAMLSFKNNGLSLTGLRIIYGPALSELSPDLFLAWGYGGHFGFAYVERTGYLPDNYIWNGQQFCPLLGIDGWGAIEYRFRDIPINISLSLKPYLELAIPSYIRFMPADIGFSVSYVF